MRSRVVLVSFVASLSGGALVSQSAAVSAQSTPLRIVVIEGEAAVNVIRQGTAVAPVIEVRDRNDQPVAGAVVNFAIRTGRATFGGARTLTVTTNAAGRAVAAGFTPTGTGALQIGATATFQGQAAAGVTIAQTTVQTAAQAASVGGTTTASAPGGAGGGGGGLSGTTLGIIGAGAAGGIVAAKTGILGGGGDNTTIYRGPFSGVIPMTFGSCTRLEAHTGEFQLEVDHDDVTRTQVDLLATITVTPGTCPPGGANNRTETVGFTEHPVNRSGETFTFSRTDANAMAPPNVWTVVYTFTGVRANEQVTGSLTISQEVGAALGTPTNSRGAITHTVTLTPWSGSPVIGGQ